MIGNVERHIQSSRTDQSNERRRKKDAMHETTKERVTRYAHIFDVFPDTPAQEAGLQRDDLIMEVDGLPVPTQAELREYFTSRGGNTIVMKIRRGDDVLTLTVSPRFNEKTRRHTLGIAALEENHVLTTIDGKERLLHRRFVPMKNIKGDDICQAYYDIDPEPTDIRYPGRDEQVMRGNRIMSVVLEATTAGGRPIDLLEEFNPHDVPVYLTELNSDRKGFHDISRNRVIIHGFEGPGGVEVLLHELRHVEQRDDPRFSRISPLYGLERIYMTYRPGDTAPPHPVSAIGLVQKSLPDAARDIDPKRLKDLRSMEVSLSEAEGRRQEAWDDVDLGISLVLPHMEAATNQMNPFGHTDPAAALEQAGIRIIHDADISPKEIKLAAADVLKLITSRECGARLRSMFEESPPTFDTKGSDLCRATVMLPMYDSRPPLRVSVAIDPTVMPSWSKFLEQTYPRRRKALLAAYDDIKGIIHRINNFEVKPGVTALDILSLPTWIIERDADCGVLLGLRKIRKERAINFFQEYPDDFPTYLRKCVEAAMQRNDALGVRSAQGITDPIRAVMEQFKNEHIAISPVQRIREHMEVLRMNLKTYRNALSTEIVESASMPPSGAVGIRV